MYRTQTERERLKEILGDYHTAQDAEIERKNKLVKARNKMEAIVVQAYIDEIQDCIDVNTRRLGELS